MAKEGFYHSTLNVVTIYIFIIKESNAFASQCTMHVLIRQDG